MPARSADLAALALLAAGLLLGLRCRGDDSREAAGEVRAWAADRGGGEVVGLDADLLVAVRAEVPWPVALAPRRGGGVWVAAAVEGDPRGAHALLALDVRGHAVAGPHPLGPVLDLAPAGGALALALEDGTPPRLVLAEGSAPPRELARIPGASCAAAKGGSALVGCADGRLVLLDLESGAPRAQAALGGTPGDLAPGPCGAGWWLLDLEDGGRLVRLSDELEPLWVTAVSIGPRSLGAHAREERVWLASESEPWAARFGPGGARELLLGELPMAGLSASACAEDGGVLLAAQGAVLRYDGEGRALPAQGGFGLLADLAWSISE